MVECVVCGSGGGSKIPTLLRLGYPVCASYHCCAEFLQATRLLLPVCLHCHWYNEKERLCPTIETNSFLLRIGGLDDLKFKRFALFCGDFAIQAGLKQEKLEKWEGGGSYG
jgi:hypothetical protein